MQQKHLPPVCTASLWADRECNCLKGPPGLQSWYICRICPSVCPADPAPGGSRGVSAAAGWSGAPALILEQQLCTSDEGVKPRAAEGLRTQRVQARQDLGRLIHKAHSNRFKTARSSIIQEHAHVRDTVLFRAASVKVHNRYLFIEWFLTVNLFVITRAT